MNCGLLTMPNLMKKTRCHFTLMPIDLSASSCKTAGAIIDNETEHQVLLFGLGDSYDSFVIATTQSFWQNDNDNQNYIDVENLIGQLLDED